MAANNEIYVASREYLIDYGLRTIDGLGAGHICKVCIQNGGSCCRSCHQLIDGLGCQKRNTSCTSWLCGYLKLLFYKAGLFREWNALWDEVPGMDFRKDNTPQFVKLTTFFEVPSMRELGEALAKDLNVKLNRDEDNLDFLIMASELDDLIESIEYAKNSDIETQLIKRLHYLIKDFNEFQQAIKQI